MTIYRCSISFEVEAANADAARIHISKLTIPTKAAFKEEEHNRILYGTPAIRAWAYTGTEELKPEEGVYAEGRDRKRRGKAAKAARARIQNKEQANKT